MNCFNCGSLINENDCFCENCGKSLLKSNNLANIQGCVCPSGQCKPDREGYCENCGTQCIPAEEKIVVDDQLAMISSIGRKHTTNEDAGVVCRGKNNIVIIVADGVSSSTASQTASIKAVKVMKEILEVCSNLDEAKLAMHTAITAAQNEILSLSNNANEDGPETTVVAALCFDQQIVVGWIGDSRAYLIKQDTEEMLTIDDSWVEMVVRSGQISREVATADKRSHYITQTLGMKDDELDIHIIQADIPQQTSLLLCTDGLWNYFSGVGDLVKAIQKESTGNAIEICNNLVKIANGKGGHDNITVAIFSPH